MNPSSHLTNISKKKVTFQKNSTYKQFNHKYTSSHHFTDISMVFKKKKNKKIHI